MMFISNNTFKLFYSVTAAFALITFIYMKILSRSNSDCVKPKITKRYLSNYVQNENKGFVIPSQATMETLSESQLLDIYWRYINTLQVLCRNQTRVGPMVDGGKEVCEDDIYKPRRPCLVYSFGSNFDFLFEEDVIRLYKCEVHTFDPSRPIGNRPIPNGIELHLTGLWDRKMTNDRGWKMETISSVRKQLNHTNRRIDILKIDIEGGEWTALPHMIMSGVTKYIKQICIEVHIDEKYKRGKLTRLPPGSLIRKLNMLRQLNEQGFSIFMRDRNLISKRAATPKA